MQTQPTPQGIISLDYAGDIVAIEKLRVMYSGTRPPDLDIAEGWLVRLIGQKALMQVQMLEKATTNAAIAQEKNT